MDDSHPADELDSLRRFLDRLESKKLVIRRGPLDVSQKEIDILKREIAHRERILARYKSGANSRASSAASALTHHGSVKYTAV
jgi:hypothetical protein